MPSHGSIQHAARTYLLSDRFHVKANVDLSKMGCSMSMQSLCFGPGCSQSLAVRHGNICGASVSCQPTIEPISIRLAAAMVNSQLFCNTVL